MHLFVFNYLAIIHVPKYRRKHTLTMRDAGRNGYRTQHKAVRPSTDLSDVNAIPTKEIQQKRGQKSSEFVIYVTDENKILIS